MKFEYDGRYGKETVYLEEGFQHKYELTTLQNSLKEEVTIYSQDIPSLINALQQAYDYTQQQKEKQ